MPDTNPQAEALTDAPTKERRPWRSLARWMPAPLVVAWLTGAILPLIANAIDPGIDIELDETAAGAFIAVGLIGWSYFLGSVVDEADRESRLLLGTYQVLTCLAIGLVALFYITDPDEPAPALLLIVVLSVIYIPLTGVTAVGLLIAAVRRRFRRQQAEIDRDEGGQSDW